MNTWMELSRDQKRSWLLCSWSDRLMGICEPLDVSTGNWTWVLQKCSKHSQLLSYFSCPFLLTFKAGETLSESHTEKTEVSPLIVLGLSFTICTAVCNQHWTRVIWGFEIDTKNECPLVAVPASTKPLTNTLARCKMTFKICFLRKVPLKTNCQELASQTSLSSDITTPRFPFRLYERNQKKTNIPT